MPNDPELITPTATNQELPVTVYQNRQANSGKLEKLLVFLKLRSASKPLVEQKPGISAGSEGRVKINRDELQKKLQQEPSAS